MADLPLERLQRWMQAVVVHAGSIDDAVQAAEENGDGVRLSDVVVPSPTLTREERLGIYHRMYPLRMEEALEFDYPALAHFLGGDAFRRLVIDYVEAHPSRSYTLNRLGDRLPEFVSTYPGLRRRGFCHDLARLERAVTETFDEEETPALSDEQIAAVAEDAWETSVLVPVTALRLLTVGYPVGAYLDSVQADRHDHPKCSRKSGWLAVLRRHYRVRRLDLDRAAHDLLAALVAGVPLGKALPEILERNPRTSEQDIFRWFRDWISSGVFHAVRPALF